MIFINIIIIIGQKHVFHICKVNWVKMNLLWVKRNVFESSPIWTFERKRNFIFETYSQHETKLALLGQVSLRGSYSTFLDMYNTSQLDLLEAHSFTYHTTSISVPKEEENHLKSKEREGNQRRKKIWVFRPISAHMCKGSAIFWGCYRVEIWPSIAGPKILQFYQISEIWPVLTFVDFDFIGGGLNW